MFFVLFFCCFFCLFCLFLWCVFVYICVFFMFVFSDSLFYILYVFIGIFLYFVVSIIFIFFGNVDSCRVQVFSSSKTNGISFMHTYYIGFFIGIPFLRPFWKRPFWHVREGILSFFRMGHKGSIPY